MSLASLASRRAGSANPEAGLTLVELVISIAIMGMIIGPLTGAAIFFLSQGQRGSSATSDDTSVRAVVSTFTTDVQSAETVTVPDPAPCGSSNPALATLTWSDNNGTIFRASWFAETVASQRTLVRRRCTGTSLVATAQVADVQGTPTVTCVPSCANAATLELAGVVANGEQFSVSAARRPS